MRLWIKWLPVVTALSRTLPLLEVLAERLKNASRPLGLHAGWDQGMVYNPFGVLCLQLASAR